MVEAVPRADQREGYIGGSDAAAILGLSPFSSPFQVFAQKRGHDIRERIGEELEDKFYFGHLMEPVIAKAFVRKFPEFETIPHPPFARSARYSFLGGHLDFALARKGAPVHAILECKNIEFASDEWARDVDPEGRNEANVPPYYLAQCDHYMALTELDECYLAALFGGCRLRAYLIRRSADREQILLEAEARFWRRVEEDDPPEFDGSIDDFTAGLRAGYIEAFTRAADAKKAGDKGVIQVDADTLKDLTELQRLRAVINPLKRAEKQRVDSIKAALRGRTGYLYAGAEELGTALMQKRHWFDDFGLQMKNPELHAEFMQDKLIGPILRLKSQSEGEEP